MDRKIQHVNQIYFHYIKTFCLAKPLDSTFNLYIEHTCFKAIHVLEFEINIFIISIVVSFTTLF